MAGKSTEPLLFLELQVPGSMNRSKAGHLPGANKNPRLIIGIEQDHISNQLTAEVVIIACRQQQQGVLASRQQQAGKNLKPAPLQLLKL
jgi:hypothetical protein